MMSDELDLPKRPLTHPNVASMEGWVRYASDRWVINKHSTNLVADGTGLAHHEDCSDLATP